MGTEEVKLSLFVDDMKPCMVTCGFYKIRQVNEYNKTETDSNDITKSSGYPWEREAGGEDQVGD